MSEPAPSAVAVRWSLTLIEPMLSGRQRRRFESDFARLARTHSLWFDLYVAGVLHGLAGSLPLDDRWRQLAPLGRTAVRPDGGLFGDRSDFDDLLGPADLADLAELNPLTVVAEDPLDSLSGSFIASSFTSLDGAKRVLAEERSAAPSSDHLCESVEGAVRWLAFRRRSYRPSRHDSWFQFLSLEWANAVDQTLDGLDVAWPLHEFEADVVRERESLENGRFGREVSLNGD